VGRAGLTATMAVACLAFVAGGPAAAEEVHVDGDGGSLTFVAVQAGARFTGHFDRFDAAIDFDPAVPAECSFTVTIATTTAQTGESQRDRLLKGEDFFWTERYPSAFYHGTGCRRAPPGFELYGELTLRGVTRPVKLQFSLEPRQGGVQMTGEALLQRLDFGVGPGEWADTEWVGGDVSVRFDLALPPVGAATVR
jgi:polyisoprenoid-binding protein YceI